MASKEKDGQEGRPIPNAVCHDNSKSSTITPSSASVSHARPSRVGGDVMTAEPITISLQGPPRVRDARELLCVAAISAIIRRKRRAPMRA